MADEIADQFSIATGFQVLIQGAPEKGETGDWKAVRGGGIRFNENAGVTIGSDPNAKHSLGQREWEDVTLIGPVSKERKAMMEWYLLTVDGGDHRKNMSIVILGKDSKETHRYDYEECFLTAYSLTPLDADSETECEETVELCVARSPNYLK